MRRTRDSQTLRTQLLPRILPRLILAALKVAWISFFPVEWLPDLPEPLRHLPRQHPATWQRVLLEEFTSTGVAHDPKAQGDAPRNWDLELHVISVRRQYPKRYSFQRDGVTFYCLKLPRGMRTLSLFWWETMLIRRCLRDVKPDLVHAWGTERGTALVASRLPYPYLVTMQGLLQWYLEKVDLGPFVKLEAQLERLSLRRAPVATVESSFGVNWLREHYPRLEVRQAEHAPNWLFHRLERRPQTKPLRFLFVGVMAPIKGTDLLLHALDQLRSELDFQLIIVGAGPPEYLSKLKTETSPALWERITLRHGLSQPEVAEEMARATMVLFPTRADNSPNSVKESVVAGVPVVGSALGGILDYVVPGRNGCTFAAGNLAEFVTAIRTAAAHPLFSQGNVDPETLASMRDYLSPHRMAERFYSAYQRVLERDK
jgi:glycosyltransferase involved in cell wall biosynthesis